MQIGRPSSALPALAHMTNRPWGQASVRSGEGQAHSCLCPRLPTLATHLAVLRLLQAEAAGVDLALSLWVDLDELIVLGVPAGLGGLWGTLSSMGEGLGSVQKVEPPFTHSAS